VAGIAVRTDEIMARVVSQPQAGHALAQFHCPGRVGRHGLGVRLNREHHPLGLGQPGEVSQTPYLRFQVRADGRCGDGEDRHCEHAAQAADGAQRLPGRFQVRLIQVEMKRREGEVVHAEHLRDAVDVGGNLRDAQVRPVMVQGEIDLGELEFAHGPKSPIERVTGEAKRRAGDVHGIPPARA
jgi:hypothetical protein